MVASDWLDGLGLLPVPRCVTQYGVSHLPGLECQGCQGQQAEEQEERAGHLRNGPFGQAFSENIPAPEGEPIGPQHAEGSSGPDNHRAI